MPKEEYIIIAGVQIPTDPNQRNAFQRGIVKGWNAALAEAIKTVEENLPWLSIDEGGENNANP